MTLRHPLTMTAGLDWNDQGFFTGDPRNDTSLMEASDDWVQYAIDQASSPWRNRTFLIDVVCI